MLFRSADNHDVTRIHTILKDKQQIEGLYTMLYCMPGIPCLYYGSEWGAEGDKHDGDPALRPCFDKPVENSLTEFIGELSRIKLQSKALSEGSYKNETILNKQIVIRREAQDETVFAAINADQSGFNINVNYHGPATDLFTGESRELNGCIELEPYGVKLYRLGPPRAGDKAPAPKAEAVTVSVPAPEYRPEPKPEPKSQPESKPQPEQSPVPGALNLVPTDIPLRYTSQDGTPYIAVPCNDPALEKLIRAVTGK